MYAKEVNRVLTRLNQITINTSSASSSKSTKKWDNILPDSTFYFFSDISCLISFFFGFFLFLTSTYSMHNWSISKDDIL